MSTGGNPLVGVHPRKSHLDLALSIHIVADPSLGWTEAARKLESVPLGMLRPLYGIERIIDNYRPVDTEKILEPKYFD